MQFRPDINGLRGIAVALVVLFHINPNIMPGGFIGVDVFFLVSGFLMTSIVIKSLEQGKFSYFEFVISRCNRILPPLIILVTLLSIFGAFYLSALDYRELAKHSISSLLFISNIVFDAESGYFDVDSHYKWLLHTWSLSVEWQFYLVYPLLCLGLYKLLGPNKLKTGILVVFAISFVFNIFLVNFDPSSAYFSLFSRAWQMLFGALLFFYSSTKPTKHSKLIELTGFIIIILSALLITEESMWPSHLALIPLLGASLIIWSRNANSVLTNNRLVAYVGLWSYSIYLWHWPLVVYSHSIDCELNIFLGFAISVFLGAASFYCVERNKILKMIGKTKVTIIAIALVVLNVCFSLYIFINNGLVERFSGEKYEDNIAAMEAVADWTYPSPNVTIDGLEYRLIDNGQAENILFIGASHIEQIYPYVKKHFSNYNSYFLTSEGCFVTKSMKNPDLRCSNIQNFSKAFEKIVFSKVVLGFYTFDAFLPLNDHERRSEISIRIKEFDQVLRKVKEHTNDIYLILGGPIGDAYDPRLAVRKSLPQYVLLSEVNDKYKTHNFAMSQLNEVYEIKVINPVEHLCSNQLCNTKEPGGRFYYKDTNHMRPWYVVEKLTFLNVITNEY